MSDKPGEKSIHYRGRGEHSVNDLEAIIEQLNGRLIEQNKPAPQSATAPREWRIVGGLRVYDRPGGPPGNQRENFVRGLCLELNEEVHVISYDAYLAACKERDELLAKVKQYASVLNGAALDRDRLLRSEANLSAALDDIVEMINGGFGYPPLIKLLERAKRVLEEW